MPPFVEPSAPSLEDEEALMEAQEARDRGTQLIRDHLEEHLANNPSSTYVTWIATLHPENATVTIDERFLIPNNPWLVVYAEAVEQNKFPPKEQDVSPAKKSVDDVEQPHQEQEDDEASSTAQPQGEVDVSIDPLQNSTLPYRRFGLIEYILEVSLVVAAALVTLTIELVSLYLYMSGVFCMYLSDGPWHHRIQHQSFWYRCLRGISWLVRGICWMLGHLFHGLDLFVLVLSSLMVEVLAGLGAMLCGGLFALCNKTVAQDVHQHIRRVSHLVRWACRTKFRPTNNKGDDKDNTKEKGEKEDTISTSTTSTTTHQFNGSFKVHS
eukprot:CAMPEP_0198285348 /NCGR_PEP_ID=MMETSP1449-20131203/4670_1 /TAXON_ID=420275 /ORGANISM="Attheya septentrionalis, Strain CCMP2084" /LENGTH=323 /DNA_ID=CAMNT_0043982753 /DNA_START=44 /DNA_END=1015 /DNA_ORIENTATION=-